MKAIDTITLIALCATATTFGQGSLTPSGAPAPTMKTLDELNTEIIGVSNTVERVEARTPLPNNGTTIYISQSGSYYLTNNLTVASGNGVYINVSGVTLDLNGFTIRSTQASPVYSGVYIISSDVSVFNGHITSGITYDSEASGDQYTGAGFKNGIYANYTTSKNIQVHDVSVSGCDQHGIYLDGSGARVESCAVNTAGNYGIKAESINNCTAITCGGKAMSGNLIADCKGWSTGDTGIYSYGSVNNSYGITTSTSTYMYGIYANFSVQNSYGSSAGANGIQCIGSVNNSYGYTSSTSTSADGIYASTSVQNSYGYSKGDDGIECYGSVNNSYGNTSSTNEYADGIHAYRTVQNSYGYSAGDEGIDCSGTVNNCYGSTFSTSVSANGIYAPIIQNSYGHTKGGDGILALKIVSYSYGYSIGTNAVSDGIDAPLAIGCSSYGGEHITQKYLMP